MVDWRSLTNDEAGAYRRTGLLLLACVIVFGCAEKNLIPAPRATTGSLANAASEQVAGVCLTLTSGRWNGIPHELPELATPLYVRIDNNSEHPLRLRYDAFELVGAKEKVLVAQAPYALEIDGAVVRPVLLPQNYLGPEPGFTPAPHYRTPDGRTFFPRAPWNYDEYTPKYNLWSYPLPTKDMLAKGIPEGVLDPGGTITGFLYFAKIPADLERPIFKMEMVNAESGNSFGTIRIPMTVS
jgi:hypothetical protein